MKRATVVEEHIKGMDKNFNPRPREEGDYQLQCERFILAYFNPRPREEGDNLDFGLGLPCGISIHALVKRATNILSKPKSRE